MLFIIDREPFLDGLQHISSVIEKKQTILILSNVILSASNNSLVLRGSDLEIQLVIKLPVILKESGNITVSIEKLLNIVRNLKELSKITCQLKENIFCISSSRSRFQLSTLDPVNYPEFSLQSYSNKFKVSTKIFHNILAKTYFCMAIQDVRYFLNAVMLEISDHEIKAVASDGHRLAICSREEENLTEHPQQLLIPRKSVSELIQLLDKIDTSADIDTGEGNLRLTIEGFQFFTKLIDGKFPNFIDVFSEERSKKIILATKVIKEAVTRVMVLSHEKNRGITFTFSENLLSINTINSIKEKGNEELDISYLETNFEVDLNCNYVLEALNNIESENVLISFGNSSNICFFQNPDDNGLIYIVMPQHI